MSRIIAETHYQLGVAQGFNAQYDEDVESLNSGIKIIKEKTKNMKEAHKLTLDLLLTWQLPSTSTLVILKK